MIAKKLIVVILVSAMFFCIAGVMAEGSGGSSDNSGGGSSDSGGSSDTSHKSSGSSDTSGSSADRSGSKDTTGSTKDTSSGSKDTSSGSAGSTGSGSATDKSSSSQDTSAAPSVADSKKDSSSSSAEVEIERGITTITARESQQMNDISSSSSGIADPAKKTHDAADVATTSLTALATVPGQQASEIAGDAKVIEGSLTKLRADENTIKSRNGFTTALFGGDKASATDIETEIKNDLALLDTMDKRLSDPTMSPALKSFTMAREASIRAELTRLQGIAAAELAKKGLFG